MTDHEYLSQLTKVEIYCEILLAILRYTEVKSYSSDDEYIKILTKKLKFQNSHDFDLYRACIDQTEDAQYAINDFNKNGLSTKSGEIGEMYLRLYGVLNSCYLQSSCIIDFVRLFNFTNQKEVKADLKSLKIIEIRNKIASHSTNYQDSDKNFSYFKLVQSSLSKSGKNISIVGKNYVDNESFDISELLLDFTKKIEFYLDKIIEKELYSRRFRKDLFEWMEYRHSFIKNNFH